MLEDKKPFLILFLTTALLVVGVGGATVATFYKVAFSEARARLIETAQSQARLIEAVARFDNAASSDYPGGSEAATILQLKEAHRNYRGFGETGEFTLAKREGDNIVFVLSHRHLDLDKPKPVPFDSALAEPMRRALSGESGSLIGPDYRGVMVLAAYEPVAELNMGIVAKLDITEVRAPFIQAAAILIIISLLLLGFAAFVFRKVSNPIIQRLSEQLHELETLNHNLESEVRDRTEEVVSRIRELEKSREEITETSARNMAILDSIHDAFFAVDKEWRLTYANAQAEDIFGHSVQELNGQILWDVIPEFASAFYKSLVRSMKDNKPTTLEGLYPPSQHWFDMRAYPTKEGLSVYLLDDTDKHEAEKELIRHRDRLEELVAEKTIEVQNKAVELEKALEQEKEFNFLQQKFVALVSHEFRTPLTIIDGAAQRLIRREHKLRPGEVVERSQKVRDAVTRMINLIDITLYLSRLDAGKIDLQLAPCNIEELLKDTCNRQAELSPAHQIKLDINGLPEETLMDRRLIDQVFTNLLSNAVKYAPDDPLIEVLGWAEDGKICISFTDHGVGIPAEELPKMFERYFRASTAASIKGTGLGLSISREFMDMHGGDISVVSTEGQGATFTINLPTGGGSC